MVEVAGRCNSGRGRTPEGIWWRHKRAAVLLQSSALGFDGWCRLARWIGLCWPAEWDTAVPSCMKFWMVESAGHQSGTGWWNHLSEHAPAMMHAR